VRLGFFLLFFSLLFGFPPEKFCGSVLGGVSALANFVIEISTHGFGRLRVFRSFPLASRRDCARWLWRFRRARRWLVSSVGWRVCPPSSVSSVLPRYSLRWFALFPCRVQVLYEHVRVQPYHLGGAGKCHHVAPIRRKYVYGMS